MRTTLRYTWLHTVTLIGLMLLAAAAVLTPRANPARASSHREAPLISTDPQADNTDLYAWVDQTDPTRVNIVANYIPFENPDGAPNYFHFSDDVLYEINIDNVGDAKSHVTYQFRFKTTTQNPNTFLYPTGPITSLDDADFNVRQTYTITEVVTPISGPVVTTRLGENLRVPPINVGSKSTPNYDALATAAIQTLTAGSDQIKVFAGPRDDPFWVDLGSIFDLLSLRGQAPPVGYSTGKTFGIDNLTGFNVYSLAVQVPISRIFAGAPAGETVVGGWTSASRPATRVLTGVAGIVGGTGAESFSGDLVQVSRLGMPLVNEAVMPVALKDAFNNLQPEGDAALYTATGAPLGPIGDVLQTSVENPELGRLLCGLYSVPMPRDANSDCNTEVNLSVPGSGRVDIFKIFLTGMTLTRPFTITTASGPVSLPAGTVVNQPTKGTDGSGAGIAPAEMLRLNTALKGNLCAPTPSRLGILGGDACGFPNGRRLADDVVEIELLAVAGAAFNVLAPAPESFSFNPALVDVLTDSVDGNDKPYLAGFPYLATPHQGQEHLHTNLYRLRLLQVAR